MGKLVYIYIYIYIFIIWFFFGEYFRYDNLLPVISSRAGGRKFQKKKETIGRSDALVIFAPHTRVLHLAQRTKSTNQAGFESIKISTCFLLFYDMSRFFIFACVLCILYFLFTFLLKSLLSLYFSTFSLLFYWNLYFLFTFLLKSLLSLSFPIEISTWFGLT